MPVTTFVLVPSTDDASLKQKAASVKQINGCDHVFYGTIIENPATGYVVATWSSSSPDKQRLTEAIGHPGAQIRTVELETLAVLQAPCTEIVTAYGIQDGFEKNVRDFAAKVDAEKLAGYQGGAIAKVAEEISKEDGGEKGPALLLVIGWDSLEAHTTAAKAKPGVILDNIHMIQEKRKDLDLVHVNFKEL